jgi:RNA polymerase sigma factor (sigma-70 family)
MTHDETDAKDRRLLASGDHSQLVESYYGHIVRRCRAGTRNEHDALDAAANVAVRLLDELKRGRRYSVPYRVVVNKVIDWKVKEHYQPGRLTEVELGDHDNPAADPYSEFESDYDLAVLLEGLPEREYQVALLRFQEGLEPDEIAERLDISRNAVDQAWHRAKQKLRKRAQGDDQQS